MFSLQVFRSSALLVLLISSLRAAEPDALAIDAVIQARHVPYGTILNPDLFERRQPDRELHPVRRFGHLDRALPGSRGLPLRRHRRTGGDGQPARRVWKD